VIGRAMKPLLIVLGIQMSTMPAWGKTLDDAAIWDMRPGC
jgi:hypothetical protein